MGSSTLITALMFAAANLGLPQDSASGPHATLPERQIASGIAPFADYHAHLFSEHNSERYWTPQLAGVAVPLPVAQLLRKCAELTGGRNSFRNRLALVHLYSEDSLFIDYRSGRNSWVRGPEVASMLATSQAWDIFKGRPFRLTPVSYVAGYLLKKRTPLRAMSVNSISSWKGAGTVRE